MLPAFFTTDSQPAPRLNEIYRRNKSPKMRWLLPRKIKQTGKADVFSKFILPLGGFYWIFIRALFSLISWYDS